MACMSAHPGGGHGNGVYAVSGAWLRVPGLASACAALIMMQCGMLGLSPIKVRGQCAHGRTLCKEHCGEVVEACYGARLRGGVGGGTKHDAKGGMERLGGGGGGGLGGEMVMLRADKARKEDANKERGSGNVVNVPVHPLSGFLRCLLVR